MKKYNKKLIAIQVTLAVCVVIGAVYYFNSTKKNELDYRIEALNAIYNENREADDLDKFAKDNSYEVYPTSTINNKYSFIKTSSDVVENKYDNVKNATETYFIIKDYDSEDGTNFIAKVNSEETEITISIYYEAENMLLIEQKVYVDCEVSECNSENTKLEVYYNQYLYDVKNDNLQEFNTIGEDDLELKDIEGDIDLFFKELQKIYKIG